jgi:hypothetical protein
MDKYTYRVVIENGAIMAYIDMDGNPVIGQPHFPGATEPWASESAAEEWVIQHTAELNTSWATNESARIAKEEQETLNNQRLEEIHAMLTQLTTTN